MLSSSFQALIVPSAAAPSRVDAANQLNDQGVLQWQAGRRTEAMALFDRAAHADARFAVPWHNRGAIYLIEGQFAQAVAHLARAVELAPDWTLPWTHLAQAYLRTGESTKALATSDAARALDPTLPDVRTELGTVLRARAKLARVNAARKRTFFFLTLAAAAAVTLLTSGLAFATLAVPVYRFVLYVEAMRQRDGIMRELRAVESAEANPPDAAPPADVRAPAVAVVAAPRPASAPYVAAGELPPFSAADLDPRAHLSTRFRRTGWLLLLMSILLTISGAAAIVATLYVPVNTADGEMTTVLQDGVLSLSGITCLAIAWLFTAGALAVGALAAFRRRRVGWGIAIVTAGVLGLLCALVPAQLMVLVYLLAMPTSPGKAARETAHLIHTAA